ncbi:extracellular calcium-sensing receptor-like [Discoglossus pictus]
MELDHLQYQYLAWSMEGLLSELNWKLSRMGDLKGTMMEPFQRQAASQFTTPEERCPQHVRPVYLHVPPAVGRPVSSEIEYESVLISKQCYLILFSFRSFRWVLAFMFAVEEQNGMPGALPNLTLRAGVLDSCSATEGSLKGTAWLISGDPGGPMNYQCGGPPHRLAAILGDAGAESVLNMAHVTNLYRYSQISYFTPPPELSNSQLFPSSLSVAPALSSQAKGLVRLLLTFGWSWVGVLSQEGDVSTVGKAFRNELHGYGICLAFWENIPSSPAEVARISSVIRHSTANIVVVFSLEAYLNPVLVDLAQTKENKSRVWLSTEAWSTSPRLVNPFLSRFLKGSLGLVLRNGAAPGFKEFVFGLRPSQFNNDPFLREFWEEAFGCKWEDPKNTHPMTSSNPTVTSMHAFYPSSSLRLEDPARLQIFSDIGDLRVTYNVYKAVKMVARALRDMAETGSVDMHHFESWQFLHYLRKVRLKGNVGDELYFDSLGNAPAVYDIINWQEKPSGATSWELVGSYQSGAPPGPPDPSAQIVVSLVSGKHSANGNRTAALIAYPVHQEKSPIRLVDSNNCFICSDDQWPNAAHDQCLPKAVELLSFSEPLGISLGTTSAVSSFLPVVVLILFLRNRDTPLVRANNRALSFILLAALAMSFLCPLLLIAPPSPHVCLVRQAAFGVIFTLCISCILAKTLIVVIAFRANKPGGCAKVLMGPQWPILIALSCTILQFVLCFFWIILSPPFPQQDGKSRLGILVLQCNEGLGFWFMLGYLGLLSAICFVVAFLARKLPGAFNEATHITFSMLVFLSVWVSFVPAYLSIHGKLAVATEIFAIISSSAGLLLCIFSPKCYIILLRPQLNTRASVSGHQESKLAYSQHSSSFKHKRASKYR